MLPEVVMCFLASQVPFDRLSVLLYNGIRLSLTCPVHPLGEQQMSSCLGKVLFLLLCVVRRVDRLFGLQILM